MTADTSTAADGVTPLPLGAAGRALARCAAATASLVAGRRLSQPAGNRGREISFADGTSASVYRETVSRREALSEPVVLVVCFRLRRAHRAWSHTLFRLESELNTILFAGFPGFVSKLWLRHDQHGMYRGVYQWDGVDPAIAYVRALWWALALVSEKDSIRYRVLPGQDRDDVVAGPTTATGDAGDWWRPVTGAEVPAQVAGGAADKGRAGCRRRGA